MRLRALSVLVFAVLLALPAAAQEQRGTIDGIVKDTSGGVLPGATVEAKSDRSGVLTTVTDSTGTFRFPSVLPGTYTVTASLSNFKSFTITDVIVTLGSIKTLDFALPLATVTEQVNVTAQSPIVDVKQSGRSTNIHKEQIELLPHNRDFTGLVIQAPGANQESKSAGVMIDGAAAAENRYMIDGIETTSILGGVSGKDLLPDFVEDVQVKSTGYPAEYGGSTGGVINVQTKSGTNDFHGHAVTYFQGSSTTGANNPSLRAVFGVPTKAEYFTYPEDEVTRYEPGASIGGPVMTDKMWFWGAYQPALISTTRTVNATTAGQNTNSNSATQTDRVHNLSANVTNQFGNKLRTRVAFNDNYEVRTGLLPNLDNRDKTGTDYSKGTRFPNWSLSATADYIVNQSFFIGARVGRYLSDAHDFNVNNVVQFAFAGNTTNIGMAGVPANLQQPAGFTNVPSNSGIDHDTTTRNFFQLDATWFGHMGSTQHELKGGLQLDRRGNDVQRGQLQNVINLNWGTTLGGVAGPFGYYEVRSAGPTAFQAGGVTTLGNVQSNVTGFFVQDTWTINNRLTINAGVRTEKENVPTYSADTNVAANPISFTFGDKIGPRAGFAYDIKGDGMNKVYGSWGIFYDIFKLNLPRGSFGGDKWISYYYTLDTPNWPTLRDSAQCPPTCPGTFIRSTNFRLPSQTPGLDVEQIGTLKPMRSQEASFGYEHQINPHLAATVRYVHKQLDRAIDDIGDLVGTDESYIIANPGEGLVTQFDISTGSAVFLPQEPGQKFPANANLITMTTATRYYNALELGLRKQVSNNWFGSIYYTLSRDNGNYSGLSSSDENGRDNPNNSRDFDYPAMSYDQTGKVLDGVFDTDRTHFLKLSGSYMFNFGTAIGFFEQIASGTPITRQVPIITGSSYPIRYLGRGSDGRTPVFSQMDFYVQHDLKMGGGRRLQLSMNVLNLFNQRIVTNRVSTVARNGSIPLGPGYYTEAQFYAGQLNFDQLIQKAEANALMNPNPQFLMDSAYQAPIVARFGIKFLF